MNDRQFASNEESSRQGVNGTRKQLAEAYDACAAGLYRYALMILADPAAAEDAVQQAFVKLAGMRKRISELASRDGYLRTAVRNECYSILSKKRRRGEVNLDNPGCLLVAAEDAPSDHQQQQAVERVLRSLPADQREVVHMKVYEKMTFQQIAGALDVSINTAASRYRYALEKLRRILKPPRQTEGRSDE